jgi:prophage regulatory protein
MAEDGLPKTGFLRLSSILAPDGPIPVSKSTWWDGVREGRYPAPVKLGPRITAWPVEDIRALIKGVKRAQATPRPELSRPGEEVGHGGLRVRARPRCIRAP